MFVPWHETTFACNSARGGARYVAPPSTPDNTHTKHTHTQTDKRLISTPPRMLGLDYAEFRGGTDSAVGEHKTLLTAEYGESEWERWLRAEIQSAIGRAEAYP